VQSAGEVLIIIKLPQQQGMKVFKMTLAELCWSL
jgi:hypothetical protein